MDLNRQKLFYYSLFILLFSGCSGINYTSISVPEESGSKFVKYTEENDNVIGPNIYNYGALYWYTPSFIAISSDGEKIAYVGKNNDYMNLYIKKTSGGKSVVQRTFNKNVYDMDFSPNDEEIVFTGTSQKTLYVPAAGTNVTVLDMNIYKIKSEGGAATQQIVATQQNELGGVFSPDGESIYFSMEESSMHYVWSINLETSLKTQICEGFTPRLTSDGKNILITRNTKDGNSRGELWMVNIETGVETMILSAPDMGFSTPELSPDGNTIVCVGSTKGYDKVPTNLDIYTVKLDGTNLQQLTFHPGHDVSPQWSPDGNSIFFVSQRGTEKGSYNVWKMDYLK